MSPETGNEFRCCDVINRVNAIFSLQRKRSDREYLAEMSSDDHVMSLDDFSSTDSSSESSESGEFEMVSIVRPYADEPLAHSSDESEDDENDQDGLSSAIVRGRFQDEVPVNDWLVITICGTRYSLIQAL